MLGTRCSKQIPERWLLLLHADCLCQSCIVTAGRHQSDRTCRNACHTMTNTCILSRHLLQVARVLAS